MSTSRLSALDASFLAVETPQAHMHVGWVAVFEPPPNGPAPTFADCRDHIAQRLSRAPRFRQVLESAPYRCRGSSLRYRAPRAVARVTRARVPARGGRTASVPLRCSQQQKT